MLNHLENRVVDSTSEQSNIVVGTTVHNLTNACLPLSELRYCNVQVEGVPGPIISLEDGGAEIGMLDASLIKHLNLPILGKITIRPVVGESVEADLVALNHVQRSHG